MLSTQRDRDPHDMIASSYMVQLDILRATTFCTTQNRAALHSCNHTHAALPDKSAHRENEEAILFGRDS